MDVATREVQVLERPLSYNLAALVERQYQIGLRKVFDWTKSVASIQRIVKTYQNEWPGSQTCLSFEETILREDASEHSLLCHRVQAA